MDILKKIQKFETTEQPRLIKLYKYWKGENIAIENTQKNGNKPNNKIKHNYAKSITNNTVGYYMGKPVTYKTEDDNFASKIAEITLYNGDEAHNINISEDISVYGIAYELLYIDDNKKVKYTRLDPKTTKAYFKNTIEKPLDYVISFYDVYDDETEETTRYIDYYDSEKIVSYMVSDKSLVLLNETVHPFKDVPVNVFFNNGDMQGDFECVISKIDAYDKMQSESLNDFEQFADAYLFIQGMGIDEDAAKKMRENRIITGDGNCSWLVKQTNDAYIENIKTRLDQDIYKFSNTVNMSDKEFANNLSGVAIEYKLMNMENRVAKTENYFKKGLLRRWTLICNYLYLTDGTTLLPPIEFVFTRNIPANILDIATTASQLTGIVSQKTLLSQFPFVKDVDKELKQLETEQGNYTPFDDEE